MASEARRSTGPPEGRLVEDSQEAIAGPSDAPEMDRCISYVRALMPVEAFGVRFLLADHRGYLRLVRGEGDPLDLGRRQAVARRGTLADGVSRILERSDGRAVGLFPIDRRGPALGVAEVSATSTPLTRHRRAIEAAIGRVSEGVRLRAQRELRRKELDLGLAWTAHELRGPLYAARMLLENAAANSDGHKVDHITRAIEELLRLTEGMESVLRWAVGVGDLHRRRVDLVSLTHDAVDCCMAETGQDRVLVEGRDRLPVKADALHLRSAIENLVRNALRYSTPGTKVRVIVETRDGEPTVEVDNEGAEIPESERRTIFEPLAHGATGGGTGLGLFVVRRIVERHGGTIRCYHPAEGHVAFELRLPGEVAA
ncbi:MAG TPA: HAMP domain-containing sensor histidine kinase [Actinomycetota bacterium]|nr:HAMP domain-containing sensor histidine kinase [Actinomycetota bacterium]